MQVDTGRRTFLLQKVAHHQPIRPPAAMPEAHFVAQCERCDACLDACPEHIILTGVSRLPVLDFTVGECTFCHACTDACPTGALTRDDARPWRWKARVDTSCLLNQGITCRSCEDACEAHAIHFTPRHRAGLALHLDVDTCTGCGACQYTCPADAIDFSQQHAHSRGLVA